VAQDVADRFEGHRSAQQAYRTRMTERVRPAFPFQSDAGLAQ
jgi:hypothetical protein